MNKIWADRLIAGTQVWKNVPKSRKDEVKAILEEMVRNGNLTKERFSEITK